MYTHIFVIESILTLKSLDVEHQKRKENVGCEDVICDIFNWHNHQMYSSALYEFYSVFWQFVLAFYLLTVFSTLTVS